MCTVPPTGLGIPAVGTRGLFLLETRISQEMDKTACAHQVSVGALWWGKKLRNQSNKVHRDGGNKKKQKKNVYHCGDWVGRSTGKIKILELVRFGKVRSLKN